MSESNTGHVIMKSLSDALDMAPLIVSESDPQETNLPAIIDVELSKEDREAEEDFVLARETTKELLMKGQEALDGILRIASGSEHPRAFEVAANLLKTVAEMNSGLLKLHEQRRQLVPDPEPDKTKETTATITNNNVFVGSTQEFLDMLEAREKGNIIEHDSNN
jgi:hypothetical protein